MTRMRTETALRHDGNEPPAPILTAETTCPSWTLRDAQNRSQSQTDQGVSTTGREKLRSKKGTFCRCQPVLHPLKPTWILSRLHLIVYLLKIKMSWDYTSPGVQTSHQPPTSCINLGLRVIPTLLKDDTLCSSGLKVLAAAAAVSCAVRACSCTTRPASRACRSEGWGFCCCSCRL